MDADSICQKCGLPRHRFPELIPGMDECMCSPDLEELRKNLEAMLKDWRKRSIFLKDVGHETESKLMDLLFSEVLLASRHSLLRDY